MKTGTFKVSAFKTEADFKKKKASYIKEGLTKKGALLRAELTDEYAVILVESKEEKYSKIFKVKATKNNKITYTEKLEIVVKQGNKKTGKIKQVKGGFQYFSKKHKKGGEIMPTVANVKSALETLVNGK